MKRFFSFALVAAMLPISAIQAQKTLEQQAEALLDKAERTGNPQIRQNLATQAENLFKQAVDEVKKEALKAKSDKERREAEFKVGVLLMGQSRTYIDLSKDAVLRQRALVVEELRKTFVAAAGEPEKLKGKDKKVKEKELDKELAPLIYKCRAWLYKCAVDGGEGQAANDILERLQSVKTKDAQEGQALVRYFRLTKQKLNPPERFRAIQKDAEAWLKDYPAYKNAHLGQAVRFEQAAALFAEAEFFVQKKKRIDESLAEAEMEIKEGKAMKPAKSAEATLGKERYAKYLAEKKERDLLAKDAKAQSDRFTKVQALCKALMEPENDFSEKAKGIDLFISRMSVTEKPSTDLSTFELCYLRAQEDMDKLSKVVAQLREAPPDGKASLEKTRKALFRSIAQTLNRGISLADAKTPPAELDEARFDLLKSYMAMHDPYRTAVAGEAMSKIKPLTKNGAQAAGYALQAYAEIVIEDTSENARNRMRDMALYVLSPECQQAWAKEPVTGVARFHLAMMLFKDGDRVGGIEQLKLVPKEYPAYLYCQTKIVFAALEVRDKAKKPDEKKTYQDLARKTLAELKLTPAADPTSAAMYFHARMEETKLLYADAAQASGKKDTVQARKFYQQMNTLVTQLAKELQSTPQVGKEQRSQLTDYMGTMQKYATLGLADIEYRGGAYEQVLGLTGPIVAAVKTEFAAKKAEYDASKDPKKEKAFVFNPSDFQVSGEVLGLALRANVQTGKIDDAKQILKIVSSLKGGLLADSTNVMRNLVVDLEIQIRELQRAGDRDKLKKTVANFSEFLEAVTKQSEKKTLEKGDIFFLAKCFDSLEQHEKAAELYGQYPKPKFPSSIKKGSKEKFTDEEEKELQKYWYAQVQQARQLRLSKKLPEAKKILDALLDHKDDARQQVIAEKEQNHLLEDSGVYGNAITHWSQFMANPGLKKTLGTDPKTQALYFDAYYHLTYCWFKYSQTEKVKKAGKDAQFLDKAVDYIIRLETAMSKEGWQILEPRFRELLQNERILNDAYNKKKKG